MKRTLLRALAGTALIAAATTAAAQDTVDTSAGQTLAEHWCTQCHNIKRGGGPSPVERAPPFADLVATPGFTEFILRATLRSQHATMPQINFTPAQMDDIVLYVLSLKAPR